ncbi:MAG: phytase [candidate division KSB1 bacterium]|nr:phytase [candidate division KSB1 bacterium]MDZ7273627.1 phytase [candidate division KSB1 bacterium]MDZ7286782.1 phytase [candidate division KSB1 bacterium]MDZ7299861.1 phytase [candidate division KSB1 bacterium]MDZ7305798.1 phytase [candidate division KSB1 bacterium]
MPKLFLAALLSASAVSVTLHREMDRPPDGNGVLDSVALWVAPNPAETMLFTTDKTENTVLLHNPLTGKFLGRLGSSGTAAGQLRYPNGIAVGYNLRLNNTPTDVLFVVERDNHRVSLFSLPAKKFLGHFGATELKEPYGIALYWRGSQLQAWITETGTSPDRVYVYNLSANGESLTAQLDFFFNAAGVLESILIDPVHRRVLLCDESEASDVMVYDLKGNLQQRFGKGLFVMDPEGMVLYDLGGGNGYLIIADQNASPTEFEVFDRRTLAPLGNFTGETTGTDGTTLTQAALPDLPNGSFYAVHSDKAVHVYDWGNIAAAMQLATRVASPRTAVAERNVALPLRSKILVNYPNPFNPATTLLYHVETLAPVRLAVYDAQGREVASLVEATQVPGEYRVTWNGRDARGRPVASGAYFARLTVGNVVQQQAMLLQK